MSLNRLEQSLHEYVVRHPEERQYIQHKVRTLVAGAAEPSAAAAAIDAELWRYYEERSVVVPAFKEHSRAYGLRHTSMRNLAELLIRLWTEPRPKKPPGEPPS